ncbi:MAG TPA: T9SS type A sorting domain-containing protein, partial [candidate division Zixibacteria bacterium]
SQAALIQRPTQYALGQNYPNPFNAGTVIPFDLPEAGDWSVTVYNVAGQSIRGYTGHSEAGRQQLSWDGRDERGQPVASGVYFYRISSGGFVATRKMTLMK